MAVKGKKIWIDGKLVDWDAPEANVHLATYTLHYGEGIFEGIRFYETEKGPAIFRLNDHARRLFESALIEDLKIPYTQEEVKNAIIKTVIANELKAGYIRPLVFVGVGGLGLQLGDNPIRLAILVWPWGAYLGKEGMEKGIRLKTSSYLRTSASMFLKSKSCGNYTLSCRAKREAHNCGYDEALHLDERGLVTEASAANIFMIRNGQIITPPLSAPILAGLTRDSIIVIARSMGYEVVERDISRDELYTADECFLCGTAVEVTPVREIDNRPVGKGEITSSSIGRILQIKYLEVVSGKLSEFERWLTYISKRIYSQKKQRESKRQYDLYSK